MKMSARADGDGWILNGAKQWITSGAIAGFYLVWAVTDPAAKPGRGISCFIVPRDSDGLRPGPDADKMGQHGSPTNEVVFEEVKVGRENLLGEENEGFRIAMRELQGGRIGIAALALGVANAAMDEARRYMKEREQHGKKLAEHQGLQWMLAERMTELEAGFWLMIRAARKKDAQQPYGKEAAMAKLLCTEAGNRATYDALQLFGGYGYMRDFPLERYARDIRITSIYEGTSQIQKHIIARELLREE
jgi:alkylation response protein AidB-like acyl-CoA dehydrogenase